LFDRKEFYSLKIIAADLKRILDSAIFCKYLTTVLKWNVIKKSKFSRYRGKIGSVYGQNRE
jgi:hypothetical protein